MHRVRLHSDELSGIVSEPKSELVFYTVVDRFGRMAATLSHFTWDYYQLPLIPRIQLIAPTTNYNETYECLHLVRSGPGPSWLFTYLKHTSN